MRIALAATLVSWLAGSASAGGDPRADFPQLSVDEVAARLETGKLTCVDANSAATRAKFGVIRGAILLSGQTFALGELPADRAASLVFYCANPRCTAAPRAAARARAAGYLDVAVMPVGIAGWVEAGKATEKSKP